MARADVHGKEGTFPDPDLQLIKDFNMSKDAGEEPDVFLRLHMDIPLSMSPDDIVKLEGALKARDGARVLDLLGPDIADKQGSGTATLRAALGM